MRNVVKSLLALTCGILMPTMESSAAERNAYVYWGPEDSMVRVALPDMPPDEPLSTWVTPFSDVGWFATGSTLAGPDSFLSLDPDLDQLVEYSTSSASHTVVATFNFDLRGGDIARGPNGGLVLISASRLYDLDPVSGSATLRAMLSGSPTTLEFHEGMFYAGDGVWFLRIDPQTYEVTLIRDFTGAYSGTHIWGLSSVGGRLWYGATFRGYNPDESFIGTIDPDTGSLTPYVILNDDSGFFGDAYVALEVFEQGTAAIPALRPLGIAVLVVFLSASGVLALRRC